MARDPFTQQRIDWWLQGHTVMANSHSPIDGDLIARARATNHFQWIDRTTVWGNPWKTRTRTPEEHQRVVDQYRGYFPQHPELHARLPELAGMVLVCHCTPLPCHGEVLLAWLEPDFAHDYLRACAALRQGGPPDRPAPGSVVCPQLTLWKRSHE